MALINNASRKLAYSGTITGRSELGSFCLQGLGDKLVLKFESWSDLIGSLGLNRARTFMRHIPVDVSIIIIVGNKQVARLNLIRGKVTIRLTPFLYFFGKKYHPAEHVAHV